MGKPIGEILVEQGAITLEQLNKALEQQRSEKQKHRLGEVLINLGIITENDIVIALSIQFGFPYLSPKNVIFSREICSLISREMAYEHGLLPVDKVNDILYLIMADPSDEKLIREVEKITKCQVQPFISTNSEIQDAVIKQYGEIKP